MKNGFYIESDGTNVWYENGEVHREDGPAVVKISGRKEWWYKGQKHRVGGPAVTYLSGAQEWWYHGFLHREDGPAMTLFSHYCAWYLFGKHHRIDGPAIIKRDEYYWYINDERIMNARDFQALSGCSDETLTLLVLKYGDIK